MSGVLDSFRRLCEAIQKPIATRVSLDAIDDAVFEWLIARKEGRICDECINFIRPLLEPMIREIEVWVPIGGMGVQSSLTVGRVTFKPITQALLDNWFRPREQELSEEQRAILDATFLRQRREIQGLAAGTMKLTAEPKRASEIALGEIEKSLEILRFYEPVNFEPQSISHCAPLGKSVWRGIVYYLIENDRLRGTTRAWTDEGPDRWAIDDELVKRIQNDGLETLGSILSSDHPTPFQRDLVEALRFYARSGAVREYSDKLLYIMVALESLLLKDASEPIQYSLADRLAFAIASDQLSRRKVAENLRSVYGMRSEFVHHGRNVAISSVDALREFMKNAWAFLSLAIKQSASFHKKTDMISAIETVKYS